MCCIVCITRFTTLFVLFFVIIRVLYKDEIPPCTRNDSKCGGRGELFTCNECEKTMDDDNLKWHKSCVRKAVLGNRPKLTNNDELDLSKNNGLCHMTCQICNRYVKNGAKYFYCLNCESNRGRTEIHMACIPTEYRMVPEDTNGWQKTALKKEFCSLLKCRYCDSSNWYSILEVVAKPSA